MLGYTPYGIDALKTGRDRAGRGGCVSQLASPLVSVVKGLTLMLCCKSLRDTAPLGAGRTILTNRVDFLYRPDQQWRYRVCCQVEVID